MIFPNLVSNLFGIILIYPIMKYGSILSYFEWICLKLEKNVNLEIEVFFGERPLFGL